MATEDRTLRVFVSSTFRDMQAERDELVKRVFPRLRKLCDERGVTWGEVDLRWGITDEQQAEGRVLPVCLEEIRRCRPYFIGLLGERYGWVPDEIDLEVVAREPWLEEHRGKSVTELEIVHGVLNDPEMAEHSFFYLRDPAYVDSLPKKQREDFREGPAPGEIAEYGPEDAAERAEERRGKLAALKGRIEASGLPVRDYPDPQGAGELILEDLTAVIDRLFPEGSEPDPLDREAAEHEAFARSRARVYIGGKPHFRRLDAHALGDGPPLVVLGESGSGKSALLANWARAYREAHSDALVVVHFIGSSPHSTDWAAMLRRIMGELARRFGIEGQIPDGPAELRATFANWLHMAAARGKVILLLDALNQLEDREGAPDLVWLPPEIPAGVRLLVSTLPGRPLDELVRRGWPALDVQPLDTTERRELIREYLAQYRKELNPTHVDRISAAEQCANPLFLRVLLEELRLWGEHETLDEQIERYLVAPTIPDLYQLVLRRWELDYERERPHLVRDAMALIWAARKGLSETELLELLGSGGELLPGAYWSPLFLAAEQALVSRAGLLGFYHDYMSEAVRRRYLPTEEEGRLAHLRLADYFEARNGGPRRRDELPWQLAEAESWDRLAGLLVDLEFFKSIWDHDPSEVKAYWATVEAESSLRLLEAYRPVLDSPPAHADHLLSSLAGLLLDMGHPAEGWGLEKHLAERYWDRGDLAGFSKSLGIEAMIRRSDGELDVAIELLEQQEWICRETGDRRGLSQALGGRASILYSRGELDEAMRLLKEEEQICRELGARLQLQASLGNQAAIPLARGELDEAMELLQEAERICRELGDRASLHRALGNQALVFQARSELDESMRLLKEQEQICRELGDRAALQNALGNQAAVVLQARGDLDDAMALLKEQEGICRELGIWTALPRTLGNQALILQHRGDLDEAMVLHKEEERICRRLGDTAGLARSLANQAAVTTGMGQARAAIPLAEEAYRLANGHGLRALAEQIKPMLDRIRARI